MALTSDHGEELFDHGSFEHGHALWQELLHVPLAFWGPGVRPGREATPVSLVDLAPTLLEAVGLPPLPGTDGISLWPNLSRGVALPKRALYAEGLLLGREQKAVIDWPEKLVWVPRGRQLAALRSGAGSRRAARRGARRIERRAGAASAGESRSGARGPPTEHELAAPVDAVTGEALEKLGYVE